LKNRRGRRRPADARFLISQVKEEFDKKLHELGAEQASRVLGVSRASFYNYVKGKTLPDMEVLHKAKHNWGIKWKYLDPSEILHRSKPKNPEQLFFAFLKGVREEDIEVVDVKPNGGSDLQVVLNIRFSA
jgi:predicted DNA-binding transcriptional regulator AlpA